MEICLSAPAEVQEGMLLVVDEDLAAASAGQAFVESRPLLWSPLHS